MVERIDTLTREYQALAGKSYPEEAVMGRMLTIVPEKVREHIHLHSDKFDTWKQLKSFLLEQNRIRQAEEARISVAKGQLELGLLGDGRADRNEGWEMGGGSTWGSGEDWWGWEPEAGTTEYDSLNAPGVGKGKGQWKGTGQEQGKGPGWGFQGEGKLGRFNI